MLAPIRRSRLALLGAGFLVLVALAASLILDGGEGGIKNSDLPTVQIGAASQEPVGGAPESTTGTTPGGSQTSLEDGAISAGSGQSSTGNAPSVEPSGSGPETGDPGSTNTTEADAGGAGRTSTTTTVRETVIGGIRVQNGPGADQGAGEGSGDGTGHQGQGSGSSPGGPGGKR